MRLILFYITGFGRYLVHYYQQEDVHSRIEQANDRWLWHLLCPVGTLTQR